MTSIKKANHISTSLLSNIRIILFVLASLCSMLCPGQNNAYKINDKLYSYYIKCNKDITNENILSMSDTLFNKAKELGDVKAQCLSHTLRIEYFYKKGDTEKLVKAVEESKRFCAKTPYEQYFYYSWGKIIQHYILKDKLKESFDEMNEMYAYACIHHSEYGKSYIDNKLATYWTHNSSKTIAASLLKKSLPKLKDDNLRFPSLISLISILIDIEHYDEAEQMCNEIEKCKMTNERRFYVICLRSIISCYKKDEKNIERYFSEFKVLNKLRTDSRANAMRADLTEMYYYTHHKQFDKVPDILDKYESTFKDIAVSKMFEARGNYLEAFNFFKKNHLGDNLRRDKQAIAQSIGLASSIEHTNLKTETGRLKVKAAIARLTETERISRLQAIESEKKRLGIASTYLKAQSQRLTLEKNKLDMRTRQAQINARKKEIEREELIETNLWIVASVLIAFASFSIVMLLRERRLKQNIAIEAYKAQSADRMKTAFVENISKDMARPLHCIIEGSEKLSLESNLESSEKEIIAKEIQTNSDYLTDLVNKILASAVKQ